MRMDYNGMKYLFLEYFKPLFLAIFIFIFSLLLFFSLPPGISTIFICLVDVDFFVLKCICYCTKKTSSENRSTRINQMKIISS